jgi:hypothetical protein
MSHYETFYKLHIGENKNLCENKLECPETNKLYEPERLGLRSFYVIIYEDSIKKQPAFVAGRLNVKLFSLCGKIGFRPKCMIN